ncbi:hypothetical protein BH20CHL6_BH20CHL6_02460 [soil metagenome]|jgi:quercetin dioxygenase-like cupin family protein
MGQATMGTASEQMLWARLQAEGSRADRWSNEPGDRYGAHAHRYDKAIVVAMGSISFELPDLGRSIDLQAGDRLDLPAGTQHDAVVGERGVTCLEAHRAAGSLASEPVVTPRWAGTVDALGETESTGKP